MTLTAAADAATGAMIALVPTPEDAARLALEGGEPAAELHCTVLYLGDAVEIDTASREQLIAWATEVAALWTSVDAQAFALAFFNPDGEEPCVTLVLSGQDIEEFHDTAAADLATVVDLGEQHEPYIPHVTLVYFEQFVSGQVIWAADTRAVDMADIFDRVGPVKFDRIRLAFAGDVTDVALGTGEVTTLDTAPDAEMLQPDASPQAEGDVAPAMGVDTATAAAGFAQLASDIREVFTGCIRCGQDEHDGQPCAV